MRQLVFFLEEPSAREMLKGLLPRLLPDDIRVQYVVFEGKSDLAKRLPRRLRAWQVPDALFAVLQDQDSADCTAVKNALVRSCREADQPGALVRIACRELESFYLGDLAAVADAIGPAKIRKQQDKAMFRAPDRIGSPSRELKKIAPGYQKVAGSRAIGPCLNIQSNRSHSFTTLVEGLRHLVAA